jgi:hypothetical protein
MSKNQQSAQTQEINRYDVFVVENFTDKNDQEQARWTRIGVAFPHKDGKGLNVECKAIPIDGKFVIRLHEPQDNKAE